MYRIANVVDVEGEGLVSLLELRVTLYCMNYIYSGKLVGVNSTFVKLEDAEIVYETGDFAEKSWRTSEKFPKDWYVQTAAIESFGLLK
jgi:hypothetical protein